MKYVTLDQQANQIEKLTPVVYDTMVGIHSCETLSSGLFIGPKMVSELRNNLIALNFKIFLGEHHPPYSILVHAL